MAKHRFGIIGSGMISEFHAKAIEEIDGAEVVAFFDVVPEAAERQAKAHSADAETDFNRFLARDDVDIVTVCTPSGTHLGPCIAAIRAGKHVICEKPLEITPDRCDRIIEEARKADVKLATVFPSRYEESAKVLHRAVEEGKFGRLVLCEAYVKWWRSQEYYDSGNWRGTWKLDGGGALMNQSVHDVDLLQWIAGPVMKVTANVATLCHEGIEVEDTAVASLVFASGSLGTIVGTTGAWPGHLKRIELYGDKGSAILEDEDIVCWKFNPDTPEDERVRADFAKTRSTEGGGGSSAAENIAHENHRRQFVDFVKSIDLDVDPLVTGEEGRKSVEIICAIYRSAAEGRPVELPL